MFSWKPLIFYVVTTMAHPMQGHDCSLLYLTMSVQYLKFVFVQSEQLMKVPRQKHPVNEYLCYEKLINGD